ncbi:MAG: tetratricopeptide repeat protein [Cyanobacteria bacterium P01_H01_bin.26]
MPLSTTKTSKNVGLRPLDQATTNLLHRHLHKALKQGHYGQAIRLLNYLIVQAPKNSSYYTQRGLVYYRCRYWSRAIADYSQAIRLKTGDDRTYVDRANCYAAQGKSSEAIADYDCAIAINPNNIQARLRQGVLFRGLGLYEDAITCFDLALFLGQLSAHTYAERGRTYHVDGHWNCAMGDYQSALTILDKAPSQPLKSQLQTWISELISNR